MANDRLDALSARENNGRTYWTKVGSAFPNNKGGYNVVLDAMPAPVDGQFKISLFPPKPKDNMGQQSRGGGYGKGGMNGDDDSIPFTPSWR